MAGKQVPLPDVHNAFVTSGLELRSLLLEATHSGHSAQVPALSSQELLYCSRTSRTMAEKYRKPELSLEDQTISDYLEKHSPIYRDLKEIQDKGWESVKADIHFGHKRQSSDSAKDEGREAFYEINQGKGDQMQEKTRAFDLPKPSTQVLDIGMAPGGYTATVFKHSPHAEVFAITLPESDGGVPIIFPHFNHDRLRELDVTMLAAELGVDIPQDRPDRGNFLMTRLWPDKSFGLVICDGNMPLQTYGPDRNVQKRKRSHLECSQLILAMQRVKTGGNLILLLHHVQEYSTVKLVATFDKFASIQLFKPFKAHRHRGSFYLIAKNIQRDHADAKAAVADWKQDWKEEAFSTTASSETPVLVFKPAKRATEASELLESFGDRLVTLGKPIWKMQNDALRKTGYNKEDETAAREPNQVIDHSAHLEDAEIKAKVESGPEPADDGLSDQNGTAAATMPGIDSEKDLSDLMEHTRLDASAK